LPQHKTSVERQKVDSIHLTLCYFQRHRLPPQRQLHGFANVSIHNSLRIPDSPKARQ
jgi:hypothetical protein